MSEYEGSRYLFQGLSSLGQKLADGLEEQKKNRELAKASETFFKHLPDDEKNMHPEEFQNLSAVDKIATAKGIVQAQAYKAGQADLLSKIAQSNLMNAHTADLGSMTPAKVAMMKAQEDQLKASNEEKANLVKRIAAFNQEMSQRFEGGGEEPVPDMKPGELFGLIAKHGLAMDQQSDNTLTALGRVQQMQDQAAARRVSAVPQEVKIGGKSVAYSPKTGTFVMVGEEGDGTAIPIRGDDGTVHGFGIKRKDGSIAPIPGTNRQAGAKDILEYEKTFQELGGQIAYQRSLKAKKDPKFDAETLADLERRHARVRSAYEKDFPGGGAAPAAPAPAGAAAPSGAANPTWRNGKLVFPK